MNKFCRCALSYCLAVGALVAGGAAQARDTPSRHPEIPLILVADLPREGRETLGLIRKGGPFPYAKDGTVFSNRERILPQKPRGFYHEYTVKTPRARDRGARRIICGGPTGYQHVMDSCYYTDDHYRSFKKIKE